MDSYPPAGGIAERLERTAPGYLERIRRATAALAVRQGADGDARAALADVEDAATVDIDAPTASARPAGRVAKDMTKRLVGWYVGYVGRQVSVLGHATARLGALLLERTEALEAATDRLGAEVERLAARVERLERDGS